jgi:hypothetical protein
MASRRAREQITQAAGVVASSASRSVRAPDAEQEESMKKKQTKFKRNAEPIGNLTNIGLKQIVGGGATENRSACQTNCHASVCFCQH